MKEIIIKGIRELKKLEDEIGVRKAKIMSEKGFESFVVCFMSPDEYKTKKQNKTFWSLIDCFWASGCSSFYAYNDLVEYYYRIAGLITIKTKSTLSKSTKATLYKAIKILPLVFSEKKKVYKMLRGKYEKWESWSRVKKDKATLTIDTLIKDMCEAGVNSKKFEEIMEGIEKKNLRY
jgi:hypothetical protein